MTEQSNNTGGTPPANSNSSNSNRNRNRRRNNNRPRDPNAPPRAPAQPRDPNAPAQAQGQPGQPRPQGPARPHNPNQNRPHNPNQPRPQGQNPNQQQAQGQKRRTPQHNRPRPQPQPQGAGGPFNIERIYEKYLNLLDQHIIARRKYHDLFYRADPPQKNKLERNFYNTINDIREFESKLAPDVKTLFEKRNNGYQYDRIYTTNHEISIEGDAVPEDLAPAEPHLLQSQIAADYSGDVEESVGTAEDYLKYKGF